MSLNRSFVSSAASKSSSPTAELLFRCISIFKSWLDLMSDGARYCYSTWTRYFSAAFVRESLLSFYASVNWSWFRKLSIPKESIPCSFLMKLSSYIPIFTLSRLLCLCVDVPSRFISAYYLSILSWTSAAASRLRDGYLSYYIYSGSICCSFI